MSVRSGSLFSGYGGLDLAVEEVLGARPVWFVEHDPAPSRVLAHRWPGVPNLGDITAVDWAAVEPVEVLTGGFPCQDVSDSGKGAGLIRRGAGSTRSGLWAQMAGAIEALRPLLVIAENVRGLLHAQADSDVEPCPWCVDHIDPEHRLRALGAVLADLADLGYDASWYGLRASDIGAPHARFRVFIAAWPADTDRVPVWQQPVELTGLGGAPELGHARAAVVADAEDDRREDPLTWGHQAQGAGVAGVADAAADPERLTGHGWESAPGDTEGRRALGAVDRRGGTSAPDPAGDRRTQGRDELQRGGAASRRPGPGELAGADRHDVRWGIYGPAIRRWEHVLGRVAPSPTEPGRHGRARLSPRFAEWMMGLPDGHVTDVPGLTRSEQLKALGNGVVPQQAAAALARILPTAGRVWEVAA